MYINLCNVTERLCKRKEAIAGEYGRFSLNLNTLTETSTDAYAIDTNEVPLLNEGIKSTAKHLSTSQNLLEDEQRAWDEGLLEDLKSMRDALVSMRDMFDRKDKLSKDNIPQLEKRIQANESKLQQVRSKGDLAKPGEAEKVETAIMNVGTHPSRDDCATRSADYYNRTSNPSSHSTPAVFSSKSASGTKSPTSTRPSTASRACTKTGRRSASSTPSCKPTTSGASSMPSRGCRSVTRKCLRRPTQRPLPATTSGRGARKPGKGPLVFPLVVWAATRTWGSMRLVWARGSRGALLAVRGI